MSLNTRFHTKLWLQDKTREQVAARIAEMEAAPQWRGDEFDDQRVRSNRALELELLREALAAMPEPEAAGPTPEQLQAAQASHDLTDTLAAVDAAAREPLPDELPADAHGWTAADYAKASEAE